MAAVDLSRVFKAYDVRGVVPDELDAGLVRLIGELRPERDPRLLDLCPRHLAAMTPPVGWKVADARLVDLTADRY